MEFVGDFLGESGGPRVEPLLVGDLSVLELADV